MGLSSRPSRPEPLYTTSHSSRAMASPTTSYATPRSAGTMDSEASFTRTIRDRRTDSNTSTASSTSTVSYRGMSENSRKGSTGSVNANSYCGRHSDQYLFGGWGEIVKGVFHQRKH
ncbi:hypothetical protein N0V93_004927 [Gnomoniopsis smithogilvyi]|uniref:Uncharacterized protein n=1 Tax=Gnomoniopsis smithogilvyi TaxID=1191159 RepID=A0A9W9CXJ5_9PEZI|nr:hypothetical protein N0V93_004927 [Gnomoniopsis smithogilvyi]